MAKAIVTKEEHAALAEPLKAEYEPQGDSFQLKVDPVNGLQLADVTKLQSALQSERANVGKLTTTLKDFEGLNAAEARAALQQLKDIKEHGLDDAGKKKLETLERQLQEKYKGQQSQFETKLNGEKSELMKQLEATTGELHGVLVQSTIRSAIGKADGIEALLEPALQRMVRLVKADGKHRVEVIGRDGNARLSPKGQSADELMTIDELVDELREKPEFAPAFKTPKAGGAGSGSGNGRPQQGAGSFTITAQEARNPAVYRARKEAAEKAGRSLQIV